MKKKLANGETVLVWLYPERFSDRGRFRKGNGEVVPIETQVTKIGTSYMTVISGDRFHLLTQKDENGNPYHLHHNGQYSPEYRAYTTKEAAMAWAERERDLVKLRDVVQRLNDLTGLQIKQMLRVATNDLDLMDQLCRSAAAACAMGKSSVETDGMDLFCANEEVANALADLLDGAGYVATTGQFEDDECYDDNLGGKWYVSV